MSAHHRDTIATRGAPLRGGVLRCVDGAGQVVLSRDPVTVGRDPACSLVLDDARVSAVHAELLATESGVRLRDLGSRNGTFLGGARVMEAHLVAPCELTLGETRLAFGPADGERLARLDGLGRLVGRSAAMRHVFDRITRAAPTDLTVLLLGETGTGKEMAALTLHERSKRSRAPFVVVDCSAIPPSLAESILFGHERGAFTGAVQRRSSPFVEAKGGTVFLDELGELPLEVQARLLRALAERRVKRVGGSTYEPFDARIVAATRRDLVHAVNSDAFRSDLYFRVAQLRIEIPPFRERLEDLPQLVRAMLVEAGDKDAFRRVSAAELERLMRHDWPGNVRELRNAVRAALALSDGGPLQIGAYIGGLARPTRDSLEDYHVARKRALGAFERSYFSTLLAVVGTNVAEMGRIAGLERAHVRRHLRELALLERPPGKPRT